MEERASDMVAMLAMALLTHTAKGFAEPVATLPGSAHEDGAPHKVGKYRDVRDMRIDKVKVGNARVFRPEGWSSALIVSQEIKNALEDMGVTGARFAEV